MSAAAPDSPRVNAQCALASVWQLASNDQGIIGLKWRAVPCAAQNVTATAEQWTALQNNIGKKPAPPKCQRQLP